MTLTPTYGRAAPLPVLPAQPRDEEVAGYFGIEGLDALLPLGLTYDSQIMSIGATGVGKSVLAAQFLYEGLVTGDTCVYVACDEPLRNIRLHMAGFRLGTVAYERSGQLLMLDAYGRELSTEARVVPNPSSLDEFFLYEKQLVGEALASGRRVRLVVDSLSTLLATNAPADVIHFNGHRLRYLRALRVLTLDNFVADVLNEQTMAGLAHSYPLILRLSYQRGDGEMTRYLQLGKLKSGQFSAGQHPFSIDPRTGIIVQG